MFVVIQVVINHHNDILKNVYYGEQNGMSCLNEDVLMMPPLHHVHTQTHAHGTHTSITYMKKNKCHKMTPKSMKHQGLKASHRGHQNVTFKTERKKGERKLTRNITYKQKRAKKKKR